MTPDRTYWTAKKLLSNRGLDGRERVEDPAEAILISSLTTSGQHAPCLDFDFPCQFIYPVGRYRQLVMWVTNDQLPREVIARATEAALKAGIISAAEIFDPPQAFRDASPETRHRLVWWQPAVETRLLPSSNREHNHIYFDTEMSWEAYRDLLRAFHPWPCQRAFCDNSVQREMTMLIRPGLTKDILIQRGIKIDMNSDGECIEHEIDTPEEVAAMNRQLAELEGEGR